jgi:hypothetical protein
MNEEDEDGRRLEFRAKLERAAERVLANAEQLLPPPATPDVPDANRIATIAVAVVILVTIAAIIGVIISATSSFL